MRGKEGCLLNKVEESVAAELMCIPDFIICQEMKMNRPADCAPALAAASAEEFAFCVIRPEMDRKLYCARLTGCGGAN